MLINDRIPSYISVASLLVLMVFAAGCPQPARTNGAGNSGGTPTKPETSVESENKERESTTYNESDNSDTGHANGKNSNFQRSFENIKGQVVYVVDGDTIVVLQDSGKVRIRLAGIDAPESKQEFGYESKANLLNLVLNRGVEVKCHKIDRYGRPVCKVLLDGQDINLNQVRAGFAWHYKEFQNEQSQEDRELFSQAEITARSSRTGLWSNPHPIPPWVFRHNK